MESRKEKEEEERERTGVSSLLGFSHAQASLVASSAATGATRRFTRSVRYSFSPEKRGLSDADRFWRDFYKAKVSKVQL